MIKPNLILTFFSNWHIHDQPKTFLTSTTARRCAYSCFVPKILILPYHILLFSSFSSSDVHLQGLVLCITFQEDSEMHSGLSEFFWWGQFLCCVYNIQFCLNWQQLMFYGGFDVVATLITCPIRNSSTGQKLYTHRQNEERTRISDIEGFEFMKFKQKSYSQNMLHENLAHPQ